MDLSRLLSIAALLLAQGTVFALAGIAVRLQIALFDGFDFSIATAVLSATEVFVMVSGYFNEFSYWALLVCSTAAVLAGCLVLCSWNALIERLWRNRSNSGSVVFLASLGSSTAAVGTVGLLRGPGLRQPPWTTGSLALGSGWTAGVPTLLTITVGLIVVVGMTFWARRGSGLALSLLGQNYDFARELGVERKGLVVPCGVVGGLLCGVIACHAALSGGSRPSEGMPYFLYGTCAALLLPARTIPAAAAGGMMLGSLFGAVQLLVSPGAARMMLFFLVVVFLSLRGSSRTRQAVR